VWIKLVTAKDDAFACVEAGASDLVAQVINRACKTLDWGGLAPNKVRLYKVANVGEPKPLGPAIDDALKDLKALAEEATLASERVDSGDWLVGVPAGPVASSASSLLHQSTFRPLPVSQRDVGGEKMFFTWLQTPEGRPLFPYFLTTKAYHTLIGFVREPETSRPQLLLVSGTIKSGKSTLVRDIIPGMVLQQHFLLGSERHKPVFLLISLGIGLPADNAARKIICSAHDMAEAFGLSLPVSRVSALVSPLHSMTEAVVHLAKALQARHCILWLLFDELGAPFTASTPPAMRSFADQLKSVRGVKLHPIAPFAASFFPHPPPPHPNPILTLARLLKPVLPLRGLLPLAVG